MSLDHEYEIYNNNNELLQRYKICKYINNIEIDFDILDHDLHVSAGWKKVTEHMVFNVKMDFTSKACQVLDGNRKHDPEGELYAGVVSRESIGTALAYVALNGLDVVAAEIRNAYLKARSSQKDYIICGLEFGLEHFDKKAITRREIQGGKAAGINFRNHLRECMFHLNFDSRPEDTNKWMIPVMKADGSYFYGYVLFYTDNALGISENGEYELRENIGKYFEMKQEFIEPPDICLGGRIYKVELENGVKAWGSGSTQYVRATVDNVYRQFKEKSIKLSVKDETPI